MLLEGCIQPTTKVSVKTKAAKNTSFSLSSVRIQNNQLVLTGTNLQDVAAVKLKRSGFDEDFTPESVSATQVIANGTRLITVGVGQVFDLIVSNASGAATFQVDFTLSNHSVALNKLATTGATAGQVIKFNGTDWAPASLTEAQIYLGTWNASNNIGGVPDLSSVSSTPGEYYIASHAGTLNGVSYAIGDWIISDGYQWQKIAASKTSVTSFQGRQGIVTLTPADYVSLINTGTNKITGSSINDLFDVNISSPSSGSVLKYNGSKWGVGTDNTGIAAGSIVNADISASAAIDQSKIANLTTDLAALQSTSGLPAAVRAVTLTGLSSSTGTVSASDTILGAFGKMVGTQGDYVSRTNAGSVTMNGSLNFTGVASSISVPTSLILALTDVTNVQYVTNAIAANGVWDKGASSSINYTAGNVGIGTTTPSGKLDVSGGTVTTSTPILNLSQTWNGAGVAFQGITFDATLTAGNSTASSLINLKRDGVTRFFMDSGGTTYFGGSSAAASTMVVDTNSILVTFRNNAPLDWMGDTRLYRDAANTLAMRFGTSAQTFRFYNTYTSSTDYERGKFEWSSNILNIGTEKGAGGGSARALALQTDGTTRMTIDTSGNVGIGTNNPGHLLSVNGTSMFSDTMNLSYGAETASIYLYNGLNLQTNVNSKLQLGYDFHQYADHTYMRSIAGYVYGTFNGNDTNGTILSLRQLTGGSGDLIHLNDSSDNPMLVFRNSGRLGIGTATPGYALQVGVAADGSEARANAWNTLSDERLKKDFELIPDSLEKILSLHGYYYHWIRGSDTHKKMGLKAQEVKKVFPEVVSEGEDGFLSVSYNHLVAGVVSALKEFYFKWASDSRGLHKELKIKDQAIISMQAEIKTLKDENEEIKNKLISIERMLRSKK